jgi:hypothetical protein
MKMSKKSDKLDVGSYIVVEWPGEGLTEFAVSDIKEDKNGVLCVIFGKNSTVGVEAVNDFVLNNNGMWEKQKK